MKSVDIIEVLVDAVEETIFKEWRHEGFIGGFTSDGANFEIDEKEYYLKLREVHDGEHWSEKREEDVVHVVRCKDCLHSYYDVSGLICGCIDNIVLEDFYCKHGERTTNEKEK